MLTPNTGRRGSVWRRVRARVLAESPPICFCGEWIDSGLPPGNPMSATVDHIVPLHLGGAPLERANLRPAHRRCNSARRDDGSKAQPRKAQPREPAPREPRGPALPQPGQPAPWH